MMERSQLRWEVSTIKGTKEVNQDCVKAGENVWIVCDGHGEHGHHVSRYVI
jgi:serine/threonine protein phosphatase PrpC